MNESTYFLVDSARQNSEVLVDSARQNSEVEVYPSVVGIPLQGITEFWVPFSLGQDVAMTVEWTTDGVTWADWTPHMRDVVHHKCGYRQLRGYGTVARKHRNIKAVRFVVTIQSKAARMHLTTYKVIKALTPEWAQKYCSGAVTALTNKAIAGMTWLYGPVDTSVQISIRRVFTVTKEPT
jgi:hypothetical protein